jgi:hypothetical protein
MARIHFWGVRGFLSLVRPHHLSTNQTKSFANSVKNGGGIFGDP